MSNLLMESISEFKKVIEAHPDMYKYAEVYITISDEHIIELFSIIRNQKPEEQVRHSKELKKLQESGLKIVRECWDIKTLFSNIQKDKIELESLHGTFPFWWSDKESDKQYGPCRPEMTKIPEIENSKFISSSFEEQHYIYCYCQQDTNVHDWLEDSSLIDLYNDVVPCSDHRWSYLRDMHRPGIDILIPIYLKLRSCGVKDGKLEVTVESIGITEDAEIHVSYMNNKLLESFSISKYEVPVSSENKGRSKSYKVSWKVPEKYEKLKVELFLTSADTPLVSLNVITNIKKEIEDFNHAFSKWEICGNRIINFLKRHSLLIFSFFAGFLLLISIHFIVTLNYQAIAQTIGVIVNVGLVYVIFRTYIRDMKERDHETAEKTRDNLLKLKNTYEKCERLAKCGLICGLIYGLEEHSSNYYSIFHLMSSESFTNSYMPLEIRDFVIEETPEILEEHRKLMEQLSKYVLDTDSQKNKTEKEIGSIKEKCNVEISRLRREYRLELVKQEPPRPQPRIR